jgi:hypothetical protein
MSRVETMRRSGTLGQVIADADIGGVARPLRYRGDDLVDDGLRVADAVLTRHGDQAPELTSLAVDARRTAAPPVAPWNESPCDVASGRQAIR